MTKITKLSPPFLKSIELINKDLPNEYPFNLPLFKNGEFRLEFNSPVTFFVGENGSGKSSLLEAIAINCGFNPQGGSGDHFYKAAEREEIDPINSLSATLRFSWLPRVRSGLFMRAESFYSFINYIKDPELAVDMGYYGGDLYSKSHGESFMSFIENKMYRQGIYLLDEPEAALSPSRQILFIKLLHKLQTTSNSQFIIITHSPIIMSYPYATLLNFIDGKIRKARIAEVEHFQLVKEFVNNPDIFLGDLY
jgi:predicted ATPase